jgi:hypothetical protein
MEVKVDVEDKGREKLFEGLYRYNNNGQEYSQEIFDVYKDLESKTIIYNSEILSRVSTGEFLKIQVEYEVNSSWSPVSIEVTKNLGNRFTKETYELDTTNQILHYEFNTDKDRVRVERSVAGKFHVVTPSFLTSLLYTQQKRYNSVGRNQYFLITSNNEWEFTQEPQDSFVYLEYKTMDGEELKINKQSLSCTKCLLYEHDAIRNIKEEPAVYYLSKHLGIPYKVEMGEGLDITIEFLKHLQADTYDYKDVFRAF